MHNRNALLCVLLLILFFDIPAFGHTARLSRTAHLGVWKPIGYKTWQDSLSSRRYKTLPGMPIQNYLSDIGEWKPIENNWVAKDDTLYINRKRAIKTDVNYKGQATSTVKVKGKLYSISLTPVAVKLYRISDSVYLNIDNTPDWKNLSVYDNIITWKDVFTGVDYQVIADNGLIQYRLIFNPSFLDSFSTVYSNFSKTSYESSDPYGSAQAPSGSARLATDTADIYIASVMACKFNNIKDTDLPSGKVKQHPLKKLDKLNFQMKRQYLHYPGSDSLGHVPIWQEYEKIDGNLYVTEFVSGDIVKQIHISHPDSSIWHNASVNLDTDDITDTYIVEANPNDNYESSITIYMNNTSGSEKRMLAYFDLEGAGVTGTIDSVSIHMYRESPTNDNPQVYIQKLKRTFVENEATWDSASTGVNGEAWTASGGDFDVTPKDSLTNPGADKSADNVYMQRGSSSGLLSIFQYWVDNPENNHGAIFTVNITSDYLIRPRNYITTGKQLSAYVEYTVSGNNRRRRTEIRRR